MTLIVAAGCHEYAALVVERRLTANGEVREDEANKLVLVRSKGLRLAVSYTGLAEVGPFKTSEWLPERLRDAMTADNGVLHLDRFCEMATKDFAKLRAAHPEDLFLSIGVVGFVAAPVTNERQLTQVLIGNIVHTADDLRLRPGPFNWKTAAYPADSNETFAMIGGAISRSYEPRRATLERMLSDGRPARAVVAKAVELIRAAASEDRRVGAQCSSVIINRSGEVTYNYHTAVSVKTIYSPAIVTPQTVFLGAKVIRMSEGPAAVPVVPNVAPCPCGSGKRYGRCHGRPPVRGVKPKFEFGEDESIRFVVGDHVLGADTDEVMFDLGEEDLPSTRAQRRRARRMPAKAALDHGATRDPDSRAP